MMKTSKKFTQNQVVTELRKLSNQKNLEGQARFGIDVSNSFGVSIPDQRMLAKKIGKDHELALKLWETGYREARIVATMIDDPAQVTKSQMNSWVKDFNSWDLCDQCCNNLFTKTSFAHSKALEWSKSKSEFIKRAGFVLMATLSVHDKTAEDKEFEKFFPVIKVESTDERNFVKKAVNWALRQIGKRNKTLNKKALALAKEIEKIDSKSARWIARDAIRELTNPKILSRKSVSRNH